MLPGSKQYGEVSHPAQQITFRVTNPTEAMREEFRKFAGCSVTWHDCGNFENDWEATFDVEYEGGFTEWAAEYDLEYWMTEGETR